MLLYVARLISGLVRDDEFHFHLGLVVVKHISNNADHRCSAFLSRCREPLRPTLHPLIMYFVQLL